jgi:hypothetical protein
MRPMLSAALVVALATLLAAWLAVESRAQAPEKSSLAGIWVLNHQASDPPAPAAGNDDRGHRGGMRGRRGGFGGGGRGGVGRGNGGRDHEEMTRARDAIRDIVDPPDHLTITQTDSMIAIVGPDGRAMRLSADGSTIKDENTRIERRTRWESGRIVSNIDSTIGKMVQTLWVDRERRQLRIVVEVAGSRERPARTVTRVYDPES